MSNHDNILVALKRYCDDWPGTSIESGKFIMTMWPSLYCPLNCPHCYLSLSQRRDKSRLSLESIQIACRKIRNYYERRNLDCVEIFCYWYGGEPTSMPQEYFMSAVQLINNEFKNFKVTHGVLSSLVATDKSWFSLIKDVTKGEIETSYDGDMRGVKYIKKWESKVREAVSCGLNVSTTTVVNRQLVSMGAENYIDYLVDLGVTQTGFLPMMKTDHNSNKGKFDLHATSMEVYNDFLIDVFDVYMKRKRNGTKVVEIGEIHKVLQASNYSSLYNIGALVLYLMPNGDMTLTDYDKDDKEFFQVFGNIVEDDFQAILTSDKRKSWLRKQVRKAGNVECVDCEYSNGCLMEYWKTNRKDDECFGAKRFCGHVLNNKKALDLNVKYSRPF
ncbi:MULTISPECIES: SPASM domain-containing protein [Cysteiniphilum]|uniref:Radical SAM protein n=1 Tax=Cysteiniphilum litorale TaxID=2056700 RepID=A0A8J3E8A5_9GAMM|nr:MULTISPECIES: SPASM domain-containing protein [Cysteiniphilum]GGF91674.1 hypothetical protein GCM10010995_06090 [Cysteiniphilum litorale]